MKNSDFGSFVRTQREALLAERAQFSLREVARQIGVEPSYLSKVERGIEPPPSENRIRRLADTLEVDPDVLLAMAGKVSQELQEIIRKRPQLFGELLRTLRDMPDHALVRVAREVRDGDW